MSWMNFRLVFFAGWMAYAGITAAQTTNSIPFSDGFESSVSGQSIDGTNGWSGSGIVTNLSYAYDGVTNGYPVAGAHTQVLDFSNGVTNQIDGAASSVVWVDAIINAENFWPGPGHPAVDTNANACIYVNTNGNLVAGHTQYGSSNLLWSVFNDVVISSNDWNRVALQLDYLNHAYSIRLNGVALEHANGRAEANGTGAGGAWFPMIGNFPFIAIALDGDARIDDLSVSEDAPYSSVSVADAGSITEGDSGTTLANFTVSLSSSSTVPVMIDYTTADGTATAGVDYVSTSGTLIVPVGSTQSVIGVEIIGDTNVESDVTFLLNLSNPRNVLVADASASATIVDDDTVPPPPVPTGTIFSYTFDDPADTNSWAVTAVGDTIANIGGDNAWNFTNNGDVGDKSFAPLTNGTITLHFGIAGGNKAKLIFNLFDGSGNKMIKFNAFNSGTSFNIDESGVPKITYATSETWNVGDNGLSDKGELVVAWSGNTWTSTVTFGSGTIWTTNGLFAANDGNGVGLFQYTTLAANDGYLFDVTLEAPVEVVPSAYDSWTSAFGLNGSNGLMSVDADDSGFINLYEYAMGGNPTNAGVNGPKPTHRLSGDQIEYIYLRRNDTNLSYSVVVGTNLVTGAWSTNGVLEVGSATVDADFDSVTNQVSTVGNTNGFIRLKIEAL